ncbi:hypothetical protein [uncultured Tateyamaria sp.]|uniref:hypothetical protein n=1 Tax=uncultured Tateyamaria sp. TaxID=455651 RepID=UPI00260B0CF6|nr:hypothetical protein [uncultured Tateyamaria sp.]
MTGAARLTASEDARASLRVGALELKLFHHGSGLPPALPEKADIATALQKVLDNCLDPNDPSYWVVRRMTVRFQAEAGQGVPHLVAGFAAQLRDQIAGLLAGEVIEGVRRYDTRAAWLAACLWAQADGTAAHQWQFARYRHHAALPPADAVRLTLAAEPDVALPALALIAREDRMRLFCTRIGDVGCRAILRVLLPAVRGQRPTLSPTLMARLVHERTATPKRSFGAALTALVDVASTEPHAPMPSFAVVERAIRLASEAENAGAVTYVEPVPSDSAPMPKTDTEPAQAHSVKPETRPQRISSASPQGAPELSAGIETGFAGVFVLWRSVMELKLVDLLPAGDAAGPARLALAAALAGRAYHEAWNDPALHWLCDHVPKDYAMPDPPPDLAARFAVHFAARRHPFPVVPTVTRVGRLSIVQDRHTQDWLWLGDGRRADRLIRRMGAGPQLPAPDARDPAVDLAWFDIRHRAARRPWVLLARAAYGDFARRLHGLQGASAAWSWDRLLAGWGRLEPGGPASIRLPSVPLDLVLRMGGMGGTLVETASGPVMLQLPRAV